MKKAVIIILCLTLILSFSTCAAGEKSKPDAGYYIYNPSEIVNLPFSHIVSSTFDTGTVFILGSDDDSASILYTYQPDGGNTQVIEGYDAYLITASKGFLWKAVEKDGYTDVIRCGGDGVENGAVITKLPKLLTMTTDKSGNLITAFEDGILIYNSSGVQLQTIKTDDFKIGDFITLKNGSIVVRANKRKQEGTMIYLLDVDNGKLTDTQKKINNYSVNYTDTFSGNGESYDVYTLQSNYTYSIENGTLICGMDAEIGENIPVFDTSGTDATGVIKAVYNSGDSFVLLAETDTQFKEPEGITTLISFSKSNEKKKILTVGRKENNIYVSKAINDFNRISREYYAISKGYYGEYGDTQLNLEIAAGKQPDIMSLLASSYEIYAVKGAFVDLYTFLDLDPDISRDDIIPSVLHSLEWKDGSLYQMCPTFALSSCCELKELVGDRESWNLEDVYRICRDYPDITVWGNQPGRMIFDLFISDLIPYFADIENNRFSFDGKEFIDFLNFLKEMNGRAERFSNEGNDFLEKRILVAPITLLNMDSWKSFLNYDVISDISITGFPSQTGTGCHIEVPISFAIFKGTGNEQAAWDFIKILLSKEYQDNTDNLAVSLPVLKSSMEKCISKAMESSPAHTETRYVDTVGAANGTNTETYTVNVPELAGLTQDEVDVFRKLLDKSDTIYQDSMLNEYLRFITDELSAFFYGDKSAEETAKIIQNKMVIYFSEHS